jgi:hypothetical protein
MITDWTFEAGLPGLSKHINNAEDANNNNFDDNLKRHILAYTGNSQNHINCYPTHEPCAGPPTSTPMSHRDDQRLLVLHLSDQRLTCTDILNRQQRNV